MWIINYRRKDMDFLDLYEPPIWMEQQNDQEFYKTVEYRIYKKSLPLQDPLALKHGAVKR